MHDIPPRIRSANLFQSIDEIFLGTDDGCTDGSFSEFKQFVDFYAGVSSERRENIHLVSVIGGFYGLNLIPLFRPKEITLFDINPYQVIYASMIIRVWIASRSAREFLDRLTTQDYEVNTEEERTIRWNISQKQLGLLSSLRSKKSFEKSWPYALENFDLTKRILTEVPITSFRTGMQRKGFRDYIRERNNLWIYASNIFLFFFFKLKFSRPENVVMLANYYRKVEKLDLDGLAPGPVEVDCRLPMSAQRVTKDKILSLS